MILRSILRGVGIGLLLGAFLAASGFWVVFSILLGLA